jgi:hypothetical protein
MGLLLLLGALSCQKKFDPNSYKPSESFGGYSASSQIATSNLVAYFGFEGSLIDSVSGTQGTASGTTYGTGIIGQGLAIGVNNYATFAMTSALQGVQSATVSYWVNTTENTTGIQEPICFVNATQFWSNFETFFDGQSATGATMKIHCFGNGGSSEEWLTNWTLANPWSVWNHIVVTYDESSTTFTLYVNGTAKGSATATGFGALNMANTNTIVFGTTQFETTPSLTSGATSQSWASFVLGTMDEVRIYNTALSASDIAALYKLELLGR